MSEPTTTVRQTLANLLKSGLARKDALVLLLGYADGLDDAEISQVLDVPPEQIDAIQRGAIATIRSALAARRPQPRPQDRIDNY